MESKMEHLRHCLVYEFEECQSSLWEDAVETKAHVVDGFVNLGNETEAAKVRLGVDGHHMLKKTILTKHKEQPKPNHVRISRDLQRTLNDGREMAG
ncbi:hypothetical protein TNCV_347441 [Trichonephila clavipes]|nr:hypothetical protein TNCV_347441 [Trichonephila clavipes]